MITYKNLSAQTIESLYQAVANDMGITLVEAEALITPYLVGRIDKDDLLADIAGQLDAIPDLTTNIDTALAAVPNLSIPTGAKTIFTLLMQNQRRILLIEQRELKAWRFLITNLVIE